MGLGLSKSNKTLAMPKKRFKVKICETPVLLFFHTKTPVQRGCFVSWHFKFMTMIKSLLCSFSLFLRSVPKQWCGSIYDTANLQSFRWVLCSQTPKSLPRLVGCFNPSSHQTLYLDAEVCLFSLFLLPFTYTTRQTVKLTATHTELLHWEAHSLKYEVINMESLKK